MDGKNYRKLNESGTITLIPGMNPQPGIMCGSNVYAIGSGKKRFMIDACISDHEPFINNITSFLKDNGCYFESIFITHAHVDHMDGALDLVNLMNQLNLPVPKVYKKID